MFGHSHGVSLDGWAGVSQASPSEHCGDSSLRAEQTLISACFTEFCAESSVFSQPHNVLSGFGCSLAHIIGIGWQNGNTLMVSLSGSVGCV